MRYDIRYSPNDITPENFEVATVAANAPEPSSPGTSEEFVLAGLDPSTEYFVAIRSFDNDGDPSGVSPSAQALTPAGADTLRPAPITDLSVMDSTATSVTLRWTAVGDDGTAGRATGYEIRLDRDPITEDTWEAAEAVEVTLSPKDPFAIETFEITGLPLRSTHYCAVRAVDDEGNKSPLGAVVRAGTKIVPMTILVRKDGGGAASTISAGVQLAYSGDTVLVASGTYAEHVDLSGKSITLKSESGPDQTVIDGTGQEGPVLIALNVGLSFVPAVCIDGFSITGGTGFAELPGSGTRGGGIYFLGGQFQVRNNIIFDNHAESFGGGASIGGGSIGQNSSAAIENNIFRYNTSALAGALSVGLLVHRVEGNTFEFNETIYDGGAVFATIGLYDSRFERNLFRQNVAGDHGGAIYAGDTGGSGKVYIGYNAFIDNVAGGTGFGDSGSGGAIYVTHCEGLIENNTIVGNSGSGESACSGGGISLQATPAQLYIRYNIITENAGCGLTCHDNAGGTVGLNLFWLNTVENIGSTSGTCAITWSDSVLVADPQFCDPASGNYAVRVTSPARRNGIILGAYVESGCSRQVPCFENAYPESTLKKLLGVSGWAEQDGHKDEK